MSRRRMLVRSPVLAVVGGVLVSCHSLVAGQVATAKSSFSGTRACSEATLTVTERPDLLDPSYPSSTRHLYRVEGCGRTAFFRCTTHRGVDRCDVDDESVCEQTTIAECASFCRAGSVGACTSIGWGYWAGDRLPADQEQGKRLLVIACRGGSARGCSFLLSVPDLPDEIIGMALHRTCASGMGNCGKWKDFAAAHHLGVDP